jgi:hypothetical protein
VAFASYRSFRSPKPGLKTTYLGIAILIAAAAIMPWLAKEKRKLSAITGSAVADSQEMVSHFPPLLERAKSQQGKGAARRAKGKQAK